MVTNRFLEAGNEFTSYALDALRDKRPADATRVSILGTHFVDYSRIASYRKHYGPVVLEPFSVVGVTPSDLNLPRSAVVGAMVNGVWHASDIWAAGGSNKPGLFLDFSKIFPSCYIPAILSPIKQIEDRFYWIGPMWSKDGGTYETRGDYPFGYRERDGKQHLLAVIVTGNEPFRLRICPLEVPFDLWERTINTPQTQQEQTVPKSFKLSPRNDSSQLFYRALREGLGYAPRASLPMEDISIDYVSLRGDAETARLNQDIGLGKFPVVTIAPRTYRRGGLLEGFLNLGLKREFLSDKLRPVVQFNLDLSRFFIGRDIPIVFQEVCNDINDIDSLEAFRLGFEREGRKDDTTSLPPYGNLLIGCSYGRRYLPVLVVNSYMNQGGQIGLIVEQTSIEQEIWEALLKENAQAVTYKTQPGVPTEKVDCPRTQDAKPVRLPTTSIPEKFSCNGDFVKAVQRCLERGVNQGNLFIPKVNTEDGLPPLKIVMVINPDQINRNGEKRSLTLKTIAESGSERQMSLDFGSLLNSPGRVRLMLDQQLSSVSPFKLKLSRGQLGVEIKPGSHSPLTVGIDSQKEAEYVMVLDCFFQRTGISKLVLKARSARWAVGWDENLKVADSHLLI